jgi:hypothetical protein
VPPAHPLPGLDRQSSTVHDFEKFLPDTDAFAKQPIDARAARSVTFGDDLSSPALVALPRDKEEKALTRRLVSAVPFAVRASLERAATR